MSKPSQVITQPTLITDEQQLHLNTLSTTSSKIRYLDSVGCSRSTITKLITYKDGRQIRYQHVRNVLITPIKKN